MNLSFRLSVLVLIVWWRENQIQHFFNLTRCLLSASLLRVYGEHRLIIM